MPHGIEFMYDFWYQPRQNTLISSEWGRAEYVQGWVQSGRRGRRASTAGKSCTSGISSGGPRYIK